MSKTLFKWNGSSISWTTDSGLRAFDWLILTRNAGRLISRISIQVTGDQLSRPGGCTAADSRTVLDMVGGASFPETLAMVVGAVLPEILDMITEVDLLEILHTFWKVPMCNIYILIWDKARRPFFWWSILIPLTKQQYVPMVFCAHIEPVMVTRQVVCLTIGWSRDVISMS